MTMVIESTLIKPVADAILKLLKMGNDVRLAKEAEEKIREAIRDLLQASPDENKAEAALLAAKAVNLLSPDVILAAEMLEKVRKTKKKAPRKRNGPKRRQKKTTKKKVARKKI
jgi:Arc/MetJ-type ribon-helix-helix transcriptional regulator